MTTSVPLIQPLHDCRDTSLAGGKAVNLGVLIRAGFTVPEGFVITTAAYRQRGSNGDIIPGELSDKIIQAYRAMGSPPVAVRSSATAEDMSEASMAGQYETYLDIRDEETLLDRIRACWASLDSPRTRAYLREHGIDIAQVAMAVVVQRLVPAEVAGVLFTANPQTGSRSEMLVEASWGLGEAVVSGLVQPDVLRIDRADGRVVHATIAEKRVMIPAGMNEHVEVDGDRRRMPCLKSGDVAALWKLGLKAAAHFGAPQDIEWALSESKLYLLQSRPITTLAEAESYEQCLQSTRSHLRQLLGNNRGPWVVHNISETLPHPTPLTWSVIRRFMSGAGGFGVMYRQAGFEPSPLVCREGFLELIAGRVYMDAALCPEMFFEGFPFRYDVEELRRNPDAAQAPPTIPFGPVRARVKMARRAAHATTVVHRLADGLDVQLNGHIIPAFVDWVDVQQRIDLQSLSTDALVDLWRLREKKVMDEFAPQSLLPSLIAGAAVAELRTLLEECFWDRDVDALTHLLVSGHEPDKTIQANSDLYSLASGVLSVERWLADYGHRAPEEFDLAAPRWRERTDELQAMAKRLKGGANPADIHRQHLMKVLAQVDEIRAALSPADLDEFDRRLSVSQRYMRYREDGKYYLMLGYELLRDVAMEAGRRLEIGDDIFLLTLEEMIDALGVGYAPQHLIAQRKLERRTQKRITLPYVIDASNLDEIGAAPKTVSDGAMRAFAISSGAATGPARIVRSPEAAGELGRGYILVCPSTDPSWTPLFTNAAGLILECGGTLSHGAVVAREMSIPAVVLREACSILRDGEPIAIDGRNGLVTRAIEGESTAGLALKYDTADSRDTHLSRDQLPPPPGRKDRRAGKLRNRFALLWGIYLAMAMLLPENWLYQPSLRLLDAVLWPLIGLVGKAGTVAVIAGVLGAGTMLLQKLLTDNGRLLLAKRRAAALLREALRLSADSPRASALRRAAGPVQGRVLGAAMVPMGLILGPMVMIFFWLPARVDPLAWNAPPGSEVKVAAMVHSGNAKSITLEVPKELSIAQDTPAAQKVPDIRRVLEDYRSQVLNKSSDLSALPLEVQEAARQWKERELADLQEYLKNIPPVEVPWKKPWRLVVPENVSGRWPVTVTVDGQHRLTGQVVLGDAYPPSPAEVQADSTGSLISLKIIYPPRNPKANLAPLLSFIRPAWQWLVLYLLVYIPVMFGFKSVLQVA